MLFRSLRFDVAAGVIYHFVWDQFCDWYIELIKGNFDAETKAVAGWVLDQILVMLHPFMPFVTEELWSKLGDRAHYPLITAKWPEPGVGVDAEAKQLVEKAIQITESFRSFRSELQIPWSVKLQANLAIGELGFLRGSDFIVQAVYRLAGVHIDDSYTTHTPETTNFVEQMQLRKAVQVVASEHTFMVFVEGVIDIAAEKSRLTKALEASTKEAKSLEGRLSNPAFVEKAKPEAVDKARADHALHAAEAERLAAALARLG